MPTLVEQMLPASFLVSHAIYMQTCAHLEHAIWQIILRLERYDAADKKSIVAAFKLKQNTRPMLDALSASIRLAPPFAVPTLRMLHTRARDGLVNRNIAAHGAFFLNNGNVQVEHYWQDYKSREWLHVAEPVSNRVIHDAIAEADYLLREAVMIRDRLPIPGKSLSDFNREP